MSFDASVTERVAAAPKDVFELLTNIERLPEWNAHISTVAAGDASEVTVAWRLNPETFWRRNLLAHICHRQLEHEVRESLLAAGRLLRETRESPSPSTR